MLKLMTTYARWRDELRSVLRYATTHRLACRIGETVTVRDRAFGDTRTGTVIRVHRHCLVLADARGGTFQTPPWRQQIV